MLSCRAFERSNNPFKKSCVEPCVSKKSERDLRYVGLIGKKMMKMGWDNGKKYPWAESGIYVNVWEKKKSFEIHVIISSYIRNHIQKGF